MLSAQVGQAKDTVKFQLHDGYLIIIPILVNGAGPYNFLLDTGTTRTAIDPNLAKELQAPVIGKALLAANPGVRQVSLVRLNTVQIDNASVSNLGAMVDKLEAVKFLVPGIRGILGEDFLSRFDILIDYKQRWVRFGEVAPAGERCRFDSTGKNHGVYTTNRLLIGTEFAEAGSGKLKLQLDTGAKIPELFSTGYLSSQPWGSTLTLSSSEGGKILHSRVTLKIGATVVKDLDVVQDRHGSALDAVGLLPAVIFRRIYISHSGGYVVLNPIEESAKPDRRNRELVTLERGD